jgi:adenylosuccinate synthase
MDEITANKFRGSGEKPDDEFGARTGRSRRLGWLDLVIIKYATLVNGLDEIALCKIDKLDFVEKIKVCVGYKLNGKEITTFPNTRELEIVEPIYVEMDGWMQDTTKIRRIVDLPANAKKYIKLIEDYSGVKVNYVGVGPDRESLAIKD